MDIDRKLASVRVISAKFPIEKADRLEAVQVDGWKVVAGKDEFKVGDKCVYFEVDSFLPIRPEFEFMRKSCHRNHSEMGEGFRLKTMKLRCQLSQCLCMPLHAFTFPSELVL